MLLKFAFDFKSSKNDVILCQNPGSFKVMLKFKVRLKILKAHKTGYYVKGCAV